MTEPDFSGKSSFGPNWAKSAQNGPKMDLFDYISKSCHQFWLKMSWNVLHIVGNQTIPFACLGKFWFSSFWARSSRPIRLQDSSNGHYWWTVGYFFLKLCMKIEVHKGEKVSEPDFWGKFPFCPNWAKMAQKWTFWYNFWTVCPFFEFFCMMIKYQKGNKRNILLW